MQNIFNSLESLELELKSFFHSELISHTQVFFARLAIMTSDRSKSRGGSKSPTQMNRKSEGMAIKTNGGGVKLPVDEKQ